MRIGQEEQCSSRWEKNHFPNKEESKKVFIYLCTQGDILKRNLISVHIIYCAKRRLDNTQKVHSAEFTVF